MTVTVDWMGAQADGPDKPDDVGKAGARRGVSEPGVSELTRREASRQEAPERHFGNSSPLLSPVERALACWSCLKSALIVDFPSNAQNGNLFCSPPSVSLRPAKACRGPM